MCEASDRRRATARFTEIMEKEMISRIISSIRIFSNFSILGEEIFDARVLWRIKRYGLLDHWNRMASRWVISGGKGNCEFDGLKVYTLVRLISRRKGETTNILVVTTISIELIIFHHHSAILLVNQSGRLFFIATITVIYRIIPIHYSVISPNCTNGHARY